MELNPYQPPEAPILPAADTDAEAVRKKHLNHEANVKSVGLLYWLSAIILLINGVFELKNRQTGQIGGDSLAVAVVMIVAGAVLIPAGQALRSLNPIARIPVIIFSGLGLLGFPIGTLINAFILWLIFSQKGRTVFSADYKQVIAATPHIKYKSSLKGILLLLIVIGVIIVIGFIASKML